MPDNRIAGLYLITPDLAAARLMELCAMVAPFAALLQYRAAKPTMETARQLSKLCAANNTLFIINNDAHLAKAAKADGVHLGIDDMPIPAARKLLGHNAIIGATCGGDIPLAKQRQDESATYCAFGAIYPSKTKPDKPTISLSTITKAKAALSVPIVAIGGITPTNAAEVIKTGANAIALSSSIFNSNSPQKTTQSLTVILAP